jgi:hypothetical protein
MPHESQRACLKQAITSVQFDTALLAAAARELATARPIAQEVAALGQEELLAAVGHALAVVGALAVVDESIDPVQVLVESGLFGQHQTHEGMRLRAAALDYALEQGRQSARCNPGLARKFGALRQTLMSQVSALPGCDDAASWESSLAAS